MTDTADPEADDAKPRSKLPLILGVVGAVLLGGGGFAVSSGMILGPSEQEDPGMQDVAEPLPDLAFVPLDPLVINLGQGSANRHLRFRAQLEIAPDATDEVVRLMPRIQDVLNGYLRAVGIDEIESPAALVRLRAQMLRRIQIVTGEGRVRDLLIMEFVLN